MCILTYLLSHYLAAPFRRTRTKLQVRRTRTKLQVASTETSAAILAAAMTFLLAIAGGLEYLADELLLTRSRLRLLSRDEAGYTTQVVIMTALLAALAIAAGAIIYTKVINKANSINLDGNTGSP